MPDTSVYCKFCNRSWHFEVYGNGCPDCGNLICEDCHGEGVIIEAYDRDEDNPFDTSDREVVKCISCNGTGIRGSYI